MPRPNWTWTGEGYSIDCANCRADFWAKTATVDATCPMCGHKTKRMRDPAIAVSAHARAEHGVIGMLSDAERRGSYDGTSRENGQWSKMHSLWLDALRVKLPVIEMGDESFVLRFEMIHEFERIPSFYKINELIDMTRRGEHIPKEPGPLRFIRLRVASTDGRLEFAERIEPYVNDRKTVQAMFLALRSVLGRIPEVSRPRLAL